MRREIAALTVAAVAAATLLATAARGGEHERGEDEAHEHGHHRRHERERDGGGRERGGTDGRAPSSVLPAYTKECGACHLAYPPDLLPAASWTKLMAGLDRHFGQNAELEPEVRALLERWLVERAGGRRADSATLRLTEGAWFRHKHRKVEGAAARPAVRSLANCAACHPAAERWDFDEDGVRIPAR
jgi:hypothetical protein